MAAPIGPGDWVECIDASPDSAGDPVELVAGSIYRVSEVVEAADALGVVAPAVVLDAELNDVVLDWEQRCLWVSCYSISRFRPIYPGGELKRLLLEKPLEASPRELVPVVSELERWGHQ
jgi:hypothetical protein